jgi:hypothetical protein
MDTKTSTPIPISDEDLHKLLLRSIDDYDISEPDDHLVTACKHGNDDLAKYIHSTHTHPNLSEAIGVCMEQKNHDLALYLISNTELTSPEFLKLAMHAVAVMGDVDEFKRLEGIAKSSE